MNTIIETQELGRLHKLFGAKNLGLAVNMADALQPDASRTNVTLYVSNSDKHRLLPDEIDVVKDLLGKLTHAKWEFIPMRTARGWTDNILHASVREKWALEAAEAYGESPEGSGFCLPNRKHLPTGAGNLSEEELARFVASHEADKVERKHHSGVQDEDPLPSLTEKERAEAAKQFEAVLDASVVPISQMAIKTYFYVLHSPPPPKRPAQIYQTPTPGDVSVNSLQLEKTNPLGPQRS